MVAYDTPRDLPYHTVSSTARRHGGLQRLWKRVEHSSKGDRSARTPTRTPYKSWIPDAKIEATLDSIRLPTQVVEVFSQLSFSVQKGTLATSHCNEDLASFYTHHWLVLVSRVLIDTISDVLNICTTVTSKYFGNSLDLCLRNKVFHV